MVSDVLATAPTPGDDQKRCVAMIDALPSIDSLAPSFLTERVEGDKSGDSTASSASALAEKFVRGAKGSDPATDGYYRD